MYYSDEIIEEVRNKNDIVDVISGYVGLKKKGTSYSACCPFHHEKTASFYVSREKQMYHCFGCNAGGNVITFVMEYENFSFPEAVKFLAEKAGITLPERELSEEEKKEVSRKTRLKEANMSAAAYFHYLLMKTDRGKVGYQYFKKREFTDDTINNFGLGYADIYSDDLYKYLKSKGYPDDIIRDSGLVEFDERKGPYDKFWNRVMVPILDINGKVIAFGGRVLGDAKPKYLNTRETEIFDKSRNLFAMNIAKRSKKRGIILCEGYMDVIAMHQAGFDNAVASLGTAFTLGQAGIIKRYTNEVYLAYDSDEAGVKATIRAIGILKEMDMSQRIIDMRPYKDPDEFIKNLGKEAYEERIRNAITGLMFEIAQLYKQYNVNDPEEKTTFLHETAKIISRIEDIAARNNYIEAVCNQYMLDKESLKKTVTKYGIANSDTRQYVDKNIKRELQNETHRNNEANENTEQKLLLTWMVNKPDLFDKLKDVVSEEDFTEEEYHIVATVLFKQYKEKGVVNPAAVVDIFDDIDKQRLVAAMLQTELPFEATREEMSRGINDVIKKIKLSNVEKELLNNKDLNRFQELIRLKQDILKMHISI